MDAKRVLEDYNNCKSSCTLRNSIFSFLWRAYQGEFATSTEKETVIPYNLLETSVNRFVDYVNTVPRILFDSSIHTEDEQYKIKSVLKGIWEGNKPILLLKRLAFYQSLYGIAILKILPKPSSQIKFKLCALDPYLVYPRSSRMDIDTLSQVFIDYPTRNNETELIEFWFPNEAGMLADQKIAHEFSHNLHFIPIRWMQNKIRPRTIHGGSDIDQAVTMNDYINDLFAWIADLSEKAAKAPLIVEGSRLGVSELQDREAIPIEIGGKVYYPDPPKIQAALVEMLMRAREALADLTGVPNPTYGRNLPSGTSGRALSLLMSGFESKLQSKSILMAAMIQDANEVMLRILDTLFKDEEIKVPFKEGKTTKEVTIKGGDIQGQYKTTVLWSQDPLAQGLSPLDKLKSGLQSKKTTQEEIGIEPELEEVRIAKEQPEPQEAPSGPGGPRGLSPEDQKMIQALTGGGESGGSSTPSPIPTPSAGQIPIPAPGASEEAKGTDENNTVTLDEIVHVLKNIPKIKGRVWIIGGIITEGYTKRDLDIVLTNPLDKQTILNAIPKEIKEKIFIHFTKVLKGPKGSALEIKGNV